MDKYDKLIAEHKKEKNESQDFKKRRYEQWRENYQLYRDHVNTNRLTNRQPINLPIMRETIQTWISKIKESPELHYSAIGNSNKDKNGEIFMDEMWKHYYEKLQLDILDNVDKKIVGLQGRSFKICGMKKGKFFLDIIDPYDIEISPRVNIFDLNSAQYLIRTHIFKSLREILSNKKYSRDGKNALKIYLQSKEGLIKAAESRDAYLEKVARLRDLGAQNYDEYNVSEVLVELNESYKMVWNNEDNQFERHLVIIGADQAVLYDEPITEALGLKRLPIVTWADDPDLNDIWCDGKGDAVRTINKVVNMYMSQDVENRAYRNFGMFWYDNKGGTYSPKALEPKPFGLYGLPGKPSEILEQVRIEPLGDTTNQIQFLKDMIQSSVAQTPTERGEQTSSRTTLGEVQMTMEQSSNRNAMSTIHYRRAWKEIGEIFYELMSNNNPGMIKLHKKGANGHTYTKDVYPSDWVRPDGYDCIVTFKSEKDELQQYDIQKIQYGMVNFQDNPEALKILKRRQAEILDMTQDEIDKILAYEEQKYGQGQEAGGEEEGVADPQAQASGEPFSNEMMMQQLT